jgi:hypothetical protein
MLTGSSVAGPNENSSHLSNDKLLLLKAFLAEDPAGFNALCHLYVQVRMRWAVVFDPGQKRARNWRVFVQGHFRLRAASLPSNPGKRRGRSTWASIKKRRPEAPS